MTERDLLTAAAFTGLGRRKALVKRTCAGQCAEFASNNVGQRGRVHLLECAVLIAVGLLGFELAWHYPSSRQTGSWREKDWPVWHQAHQLFQRDPGELNEAELQDVRQWIRCLGLLEQYLTTGPQSLTDAECELFVETLDKLSPRLPEYASNFLPVYEACRRRLADASGTWCTTHTGEVQP